MSKVIQVHDVSLCFNLDINHVTSIKEWFLNFALRKHKKEEFWALNNVTFDVYKGEMLGIVGRNGSGKSTLLKVISGIYPPASGWVKVEGTIAPMLELGSGFDLELSGRENIYLNGAILGYTKEYTNEKYDEIVEFSELGEFIHSPIKTYSSGMLMRLAFSIATLVNPDIMIVDEILAVGDEKFQNKSKQRMIELMKEGTTVLFVSHDVNQVKQLCDRAIWLENGRVVMQGSSEQVCDAYISCLG